MVQQTGRPKTKNKTKMQHFRYSRRGRERRHILSSFVDAASADETPTDPGITYRRYLYRYTMVGGMRIARKRRASEKTVVDKRKTDKHKNRRFKSGNHRPRHMTGTTEFSASCVSCRREEERGGAAVAVAARETDSKASPLIDLHHHERVLGQKS